MRVLDLFSGIGGFALGLEACGMETAAFCEREPYARSILARHWPTVPIYDDVCTLTADRLAADAVGPIDLICGGFPCQDVSTAGKGRGLAEGTRSGLWSQYRRIVEEIRPRWVVAENVRALRGRGADRVLADLEALGYDARPIVVGAVHSGGPHERRRVWILANAHGDGRPVVDEAASIRGAGGNADGDQALQLPSSGRSSPMRARLGAASLWSGRASHVARPGWNRRRAYPQPYVRRVPDGVSEASHRLRCLGNAVVPQVVEMIGRAILAVEAELSAA